jgi:acyl carrier protein
MDKELQRIFADMFGVSETDYSDQLSIDNVDNWDSITHVTLILELEDTFNVQISPEQASGLTSVALMKAALSQHELTTHSVK